MESISLCLFAESLPSLLMLNNESILGKINAAYQLGIFISTFTLNHPKMKAFLADPNEKFDLIICEIFVNEAMLGLGHHFNAPVIGFGTFGATLWTMEMVGTPAPLSYVPHPFIGYSERMTFSQRVENTLVTWYDHFAYNQYLIEQEKIYQNVFAGENKPSLDQLRKNVSLVLLNQHFTTSFPRPYVPNMIEVGGLHINRSKAKPLPTTITHFIENATNGVIYFSMGSNVQSKDLPAEKRDGLLKAFGKLKQRVLWKWEDVNLPGKPDNVMVSSWFPQDDVLAHPNLKLFVTHGGLLSITEAVFNGVPIVGIPLFGDQFLNMAHAENMGFGIMVDYRNVTEKSISWAINEVLQNNR